MILEATIFDEDVKDHKLEIIKDDDLYRHLRFKKPGTGNMYFDLITWPGHLVICGDMGDYHFSRTDDMFGFFIMDDNDFNKKNVINPGYWSEKLQGGIPYEEFDKEAFVENVEGHVREYYEVPDGEPLEGNVPEELLENLKYEVLSFEYGGEMQEHVSVKAINDFRYEDENGDFYFEDFSYSSCQRYKYHYIWCCRAIVWGILEYRKQKG